MRLTILLLLFCLAPLTDARAQRITLTPSVVELKGAAGQSTKHRLTMRNDTRVALTFEMRAQDVVLEGGKRQFLPAGDLPNGIAATAVFSPATVTIAAGESATVDVTMTIPREVSNRAIVALFKGTTTVASGYSRSTLSLGALFTFTLSDDHSLSAAELLVVPQSESENAAFEQLLVNDGPEPQMPKGVAVILSDAGRMVGRATFESRRLLPGERGTFKTTYPGELPPGTYRVVSTFEYSGKSLTRTAELVVP